MKKFKFINQSLWAGSSPNQTGETLTRENRIGVKSWLNRGLMLLITILTLGVGQMWAGTEVTVYLALDAAKTRNNNNCCAVYMNIKNTDGSSEKWDEQEMSKTGYTYNGKLVYSLTHTYTYEGYYDWQWYLKENGNTHWYKAIYAGGKNTEWHNGQLYDYENATWVTSPSWDESYTIYFADKYWGGAGVNLYAWNNDCDYNAGHPGQEMTFTGCYWNTHRVYRLVLNKRYSKLQFSKKGDTGAKYDDQPCYENAGKMFTPDETYWWQTPSYTSKTFSNGATVVWDAGTSGWTSAYMYHFDLDGADDIQLTQIGSTQQFYKVATSDIQAGAWAFRQQRDWEHGRTTDIPENISGVTLFTHSGTTDYKMDWQKTENAKKATGGTKIYFDNTNANWSAIWLKYGTQWFNRTPIAAAAKVNGTENLYVTVISDDVYYAKYYLADNYGWTNYSDIEAAGNEDNIISNRIASQESNLTSDITYIPSSGDESTPKVWSFTTMSGHTHDVEITAPSHGTITVAYTDESGTSQSKNSGNFAVARTCSLTISSSAATGYNPVSLTVNGAAHTSGSKHTITSDITVAATFTPKSCSVTFDKEGGTGGDNGTTATYDADMTTVTIPHKIGYSFAGYWDGDNGTGNQYYKADGTSYTKWNKNTESATTLYAKWVADNKAFKADAATTDWATDANWLDGKAPSNDYSAVTINGDVTLSSSVHIGSLTIGTGKLTIETNGALVVEGTVTNSNSDKLEIKSTPSGQGALIYDISSSAVSATVNMTLNSSNYHLIASPTGGASVASQFANTKYETVYTFAWIEGKGWERRGYYENFVNEAILVKGSSGTTFSGILAENCGGGLNYTGTPTTDGTEGVNMIPNPLAAPIRIKSMNLDDTSDGSVHLLNNGSWVGIAKESADEAVIPAFNGYAVLSNKSGSVGFTYNTAVRNAANKNAGLRAPRRTKSDIMDHITIFVTTNERKIDLQLYENEQFTDTIDKGWESIYMEGDGQFGELYAHAEREMCILATPNLEGTVIGFTPGNAESFTISFEGDGRGYYLNDIKMEESTLIEEGNTYEFTSDEASNSTRFVISKTPISKTPTSVDNLNDGVKARKQLIDGALYIIRDGRIYTVTGNVVK